VPQSIPELNNEEIIRYSRHLILDEVGREGQRKLKAAKVLCVGTGGLGSPLLLYLAAAGVGRLGVVDFDVVEASNLQRQVIHGTGSLGRPKVASATERIQDINPNIRVDVYEEALTVSNALRIIEPYDIVVDGTDNFPTRYLVNDATVILGKPNVYGSIFKFEGQASVFNYQGGPHYRDLYPEPPPPNAVPTCAEAGVLGVVPGLIGLIQATETVKIILGLGTTLSGRLLIYDGLSMRFRELKLGKDPHGKPITDLIDYDRFCNYPGVNDDIEESDLYCTLEPSELKARLDAGWKPYVLDVRRPREAEIVAFPFGDRLHSYRSVSDIVDELPSDRDILVYCKVGLRSAVACQLLAEGGRSRLFNLGGGIIAWARQVDSSFPVY
jgi:sulfur-carrier protein adenylyltransferase/sulfurtransferase